MIFHEEKLHIPNWWIDLDTWYLIQWAIEHFAIVGVRFSAGTYEEWRHVWNSFAGVITDYQLYHNDVLMSHYQTPQVVTLTDLQPWSLHTFRLKCCTAIGCSNSKEVSFRTQEAVPQGSIILSASADDARTIKALWSPVQMPNGLVYYDVYVDGSFYVDQGNNLFKSPINKLV